MTTPQYIRWLQQKIKKHGCVSIPSAYTGEGGYCVTRVKMFGEVARVYARKQGYEVHASALHYKTNLCDFWGGSLTGEFAEALMVHGFNKK